MLPVTYYDEMNVFAGAKGKKPGSGIVPGEESRGISVLQREWFDSGALVWLPLRAAVRWRRRFQHRRRFYNRRPAYLPC